MGKQLIKQQVVVGIIFNPDGELLIAERPAGKSYAGYWEFPGGKVEAGETPGQALVRECREELNIDLQGCVLTHYSRGELSDSIVDFYQTTPRGTLHPKGLEGQQWRWAALAELDNYTFPELTVEVIAMLKGK